MLQPDTGTLIVTSAIKPSAKIPFLRLTDHQQRLFQTYCSLISWISETHLTNIVLCDNTCTTTREFSALISFAERHNTDLEVLVFSGNHEKTCRFGKGYGEGEIMKHVMEHSRLLREDTIFYKITGRIFVKDFDSLHHTYENKPVVFDFPPWMERWKNVLLNSAVKQAVIAEGGEISVTSTFYKCTAQYYLDNLIDRFQQVDDLCGYYLEHALLDPLLENGFDIFLIHPCLVGYSASVGNLYNGVDYPNEVKNLAAQMLRKNR